MYDVTVIKEEKIAKLRRDTAITILHNIHSKELEQKEAVNANMLIDEILVTHEEWILLKNFNKARIT